MYTFQVFSNLIYILFVHNHHSAINVPAPVVCRMLEHREGIDSSSLHEIFTTMELTGDPKVKFPILRKQALFKLSLLCQGGIIRQ